MNSDGSTRAGFEDQDLPDDLKCIICMDVYINPVVLGCGHSFCKDCLKDLLKDKPVCPTCRTPSFYGSDNLNPNFALKALIETRYPAELRRRQAEEMELGKEPS